ncbi:MAG: DUF4912 domain-containing protein [Acidobacteriota bacterium]|nr:MAG: DUF4912 domain-containing protein [Acidobacteriota bacterium]
MPFFFDLSSLIPAVERNPFEPVLVPDVIMEEIVPEESEAVEIVDTGLPIPAHYDFDLMRAMVQDPFRLFVYWQLRDDPFERLRRIFPKGQSGEFHTVLKLIDETNNIAVFFNAAFTREYWFSVFPDRRYRVEMGLRSDRHGFIRLLSSQPVTTPRGGPSDQVAPEPEYSISADRYIEVIRESHLVPARVFTLDGLLPGAGDVPPEARNAVWESLPPSFRRLMQAMVDIQAGRDFDKWWEHLSREELSGMVREFLEIIHEMGDGELGYILLLRYLPELLRRAIRDEHPSGFETEIQIDKPILLYLAERLGQSASEMQPPGPESLAEGPSPLEVSMGQWLPSMKG